MSAKYYRDLLTQRARIEAFRRALQRTVRPDDRVLDLGTGLGTFAFFAADAGAARVWGVDGSPIVHVARAVAAANGYGERVEFVRGWLPHVQLPERVDVVIYEDFSPRLFDERTALLVRDVARQYAAPDARTVPLGARVRIAPVSAREARLEVAPFGADDTAYGISWLTSRAYVENTPLHVRLPAAALASLPATIAEVRFDRQGDLRTLRGGAAWSPTRDVEVDGLAYWFDLDMGNGEWLSNSPGASPASWGHLLLGLATPIRVAAGEVVRARVWTETFPYDAPAWLAWEVSSDTCCERGHEFAAAPAALADLAIRSADGVPILTRMGRIEARVLDLTDGMKTVGQIAQGICEDYPELSLDDAARVVAGILDGKATGRVAKEAGP